MSSLVLTGITASVSELKKNPMSTVESAEGFPIAILNRNKPAFYCVPAHLYERLMDALEDQELVKIVHDRAEEEVVDFDLKKYL